MNTLTGRIRIGLALITACLVVHPAMAQRLSAEQAIRGLQDGGYVLVMRHAAASLEAARNAGRGGGGGFGGGGGGRGGRGGGQAPEPTEPALEQQSIQLLTGMRHAIWHFDIPVGAIYASPTLRAQQHAEEIPFAEITTIAELGSSMDGDGAAGAAWLTAKLREPTMAGTNTIIVTHAPIIQAALGMDNVAEGEALIVRPGANPEVVSRLGLREWSELAIELDD